MRTENIFDEVDNLKLRVEKEVLGNQELIKLIACNNDNPLSQPDIERPSKLVDEYIFFKPKVFDKTTTAIQCFLLTDVIITSIRNSIDFADIKLIFRIIVHNNLFELYDGKTRAYQIAKRLNTAFDGEYGTWIGKCKFESCNPIEMPTSYQGMQLVFNVTDFK